MTLLVRTPLAPAQILPTLRHEIAQAAPDLSIANVRTLMDIVDESMGSARFNTVIVSGFAGVALLLSALGVFGVLSFGVAARRSEIAIRLALGATRRDVSRLFLAQAAVPVAAGIGVGCAIALAAARVFESLLFGVTSADPMSLLTAIAILVAVAFAASFAPLRRALRIDPAAALR